MSEIGDFIRAKRETLGLSQEALARACDVSKNTVIAWESGRGIRLDNAAELARVLGVSLERLTGRVLGHEDVVTAYLDSPRGKTVDARVAERLYDESLYVGFVPTGELVQWEDVEAMRQVLERRGGSPPVRPPDDSGQSGARSMRPSATQRPRKNKR